MNRKPIIKHFEFDFKWIVFEDDNIIIVNKPSGMLCVPGRDISLPDSLVTHLKRHCTEALIVHRLDMDTSGLMVFAKNKDSQRNLSIQFQNRNVHKKYQALGFGICANKEGKIDFPMHCDWVNRPRQKIDFLIGKPSLTYYKVIKTMPLTSYSTSNYFASLFELTPITGRSHQLRLHLKTIGHPILGDNLYANDMILDLSERLLLHACNLKFDHPESKNPVSFCVDLKLNQFINTI